MLVFGVDVPLIEVVFGLAIISFVVLVEVIIVVILLMQNLRRSKEVGEALSKLSQTLLEIKAAEMKQLERLKK